MKVEIHNVFKNMRYKFFQMEDGTYYIVEIKPSFWKTLFPFLYWFFPFPVYKVEDEKTIEGIQTPESWSFDKSSAVLATGGVAVFIATIFRGKIEMFKTELPLYIKIIFLIVMIFCVFLIRLFVNKVKFHDLYKHVDLKQLERFEIKVKPQSFKHIGQMFASYIFFLFFSVMSYIMFFLDGNVFVLIGGAAMLIMFSLVVNITVKEGLTKIEFIK